MSKYPKFNRLDTLETILIIFVSSASGMVEDLWKIKELLPGSFNFLYEVRGKVIY